MIKHSEKEIRELYKKLRNESEVAREVGVSRQSMYDYRIRHEIKYDPVSAKIKTHEELYAARNTKIVNMYLSGASMDTICSKFDMKPPAINYILVKYRVKKPAVRPSMKRNIEIYRLRKLGMPVKEIAERFVLNRFYVSTLIYKMKKAESELS